MASGQDKELSLSLSLLCGTIRGERNGRERPRDPFDANNGRIIGMLFYRLKRANMRASRDRSYDGNLAIEFQAVEVLSSPSRRVKERTSQGPGDIGFCGGGRIAFSQQVFLCICLLAEDNGELALPH